MCVCVCISLPGAADRESSYSERAREEKDSPLSQSSLGDNRFQSESVAHTGAPTVKLNVPNTRSAACVCVGVRAAH